MTGWIIAFLILFGLAMLKAKVVLVYREEVELTLKILFLPLKILPKKPKKPKKPMSKKQAEKMKAKLEKKAESKEKKKAEKAKKKTAKKEAAKAKKELERTDPEAKRRARLLKEQKKQRSATLGENLDLVKSVLSFFLSRLFLRHLRIDVARIRITVASEEASKTALMYGVTVQSVEYILALLDRFTNTHGVKKADVLVVADFLGTKPTVDLKIAFSLRVWHLFHLLFGSLRRLLSNRFAVRKRVEREYPNAYKKVPPEPKTLPDGHKGQKNPKGKKDPKKSA